ncbi:hypothetical protein [Streptomyces sp. A0592]|nr:hypothetical protein [Streptomyces sp. A0592]
MSADLTDPGAVQTMVDLVRAEIGPSASFITGQSVHVDGGWLH